MNVEEELNKLIQWKARMEGPGGINVLPGMIQMWQDVAVQGDVRASGRVHATGVGARAILTTPVTIATGTLTALPFDTEIYDSGGLFTVGAPTRFTAPFDGLYVAGGSWIMVAADVTSVARFGIAVRANGTDILARNDTATVVGKIANVSVAAAVYLTAGQYVEMLVLHDQGANRDTVIATQTSQHNANGWMMRVGG